MKGNKQITHINGYTLNEVWYEEMAILSNEQEREAFVESWGLEHRGVVCPACNGRGYARRGDIIGCETCCGLGVTPFVEKPYGDV